MYIFIVLFGVFVHGLHALPARRGACVIMCSPGFGLFDDLDLADCPPEHECRSTGCGTMCYTINTNRTQTVSHETRGACYVTCSDDVSCGMDGYACISNGCGRQCRLSPDYKQPEGCPVFSCDLNCPFGYTRDDLGCDHCECAH